LTSYCDETEQYALAVCVLVFLRMTVALATLSNIQVKKCVRPMNVNGSTKSCQPSCLVKAVITVVVCPRGTVG